MHGNFFNIQSCGKLTTILGECMTNDKLTFMNHISDGEIYSGAELTS